jgi:hypothetical protein
MTSPKAPKDEAPTGMDRRKHRRRPILDSFSVFAVAPSLGPMRLKLIDVSEMGVGLEFGEESVGLSIPQVGTKIGILLYLNPSLFLPLDLEVVRLDSGKTTRLGAVILNPTTPGVLAVHAFLQMIDRISEVAQFDALGKY